MLLQVVPPDIASAALAIILWYASEASRHPWVSTVLSVHAYRPGRSCQEQGQEQVEGKQASTPTEPSTPALHASVTHG